MCTETFRRLPAEKRKRIEEAAWEEFTKVPYAAASINQIIRRAEISRGSFYQYFTDKTDLFGYLVESVRTQMSDIHREYLREADGDVFAATLIAYDGFLELWDSGSLPLLNRCIQVLLINPGIDLEHMITGSPDEILDGSFLGEVNLSSLRRRDTDFVKRITCMTGMCLGGAWMDSVHDPSRRQENRRTLEEELDILRRGSLSEAALRKGERAS